MAIADPKDYVAKKDDETATLKAQVAALAEQVQALLATQRASGGITAEQLKDVMTEVVKVQAEAHSAAMREIAERDQRDDVNYPRISAFSYPEGDRKRPRPLLKCRMFWAGADIDWDTTTATELELLNAIEPGDFIFRRIGGAPENLTVTGERNASGKLTKLDFTFKTKEQRDTLPAMVSMLRDALGVKSPIEQEVEMLRAKLAALSLPQAVPA